MYSDSSFSKDKLCLRCSDVKGNKKLSVKEENWLNKSTLLLEQIIKLTYYWAVLCLERGIA